LFIPRTSHKCGS